VKCPEQTAEIWSDKKKKVYKKMSSVWKITMVQLVSGVKFIFGGLNI